MDLADSWDWDTESDWDTGLDQPFLRQLFRAIRAGQYPRSYPNQADGPLVFPCPLHNLSFAPRIPAADALLRALLIITARC